MKKKILVGKTEDSYIVVKLETEQDYNKENHLSLYGSCYDSNIFTEEEGEELAREYLDDGEAWKIAVENDNTTNSMEDWNEYVINTDGWEHVIGDVYYLPDGQIDMHVKPDSFIETYIPKTDIKFIWSMWKKYHLKDIETIPKDKLDKLKTIFEKYESDYEDIGKHIES